MQHILQIVPYYGKWAIKQNGTEYPICTNDSKNATLKIAEQLSKRLNCKIEVNEQKLN